MSKPQNRVFKDYENHLKNGDDGERERVLEEVEEAYYIDATISETQYITLIKLFSELTGDYALLENRGL